MPPKRTHPAPTSSNKRKKTDTSYKLFYTPTINLLLELTDDVTGEKVALPFIKLPPKKVYPDYYEIITNPISITEIQRKAKQGKYPESSTDEFLDDFNLLVENAAKYNDPESWIVESAKKLLEFVETEAEQYGSAKDLKFPEEVTVGNLGELYLGLLNNIISYDFPEEGIISLPFMDKVDTSLYPDYLKFVKIPTSFNEVILQIEKGKIFSSKNTVAEALQKLHDATLLIFKNAYLYNDPTTEIYQDAAKLEQFFAEKYTKFAEEVESRVKQKLKLNLKLKKQEDETEPEPLSEVLEMPVESDVKNWPLLPENDCLIQETIVSSLVSIINHVTQYAKQKLEDATTDIISEQQQVRRSLFPTHELNQPVTSLFEYKVPANGYTNQSYTVVLPPDVLPFVTVKISLHNLIHAMKSRELVDGEGFLSLASDDDIQCKLLANEEEVTTGSCYQEKRPNKRNRSGQEDLLAISYDLKLSHGLNVVDFECKVNPGLSKKIKKIVPVVEKTEEIAGRHTRHQLQQMKMTTWDVERITYYIVCGTL